MPATWPTTCCTASVTIYSTDTELPVTRGLLFTRRSRIAPLSSTGTEEGNIELDNVLLVMLLLCCKVCCYVAKLLLYFYVAVLLC